MKIQSNSEVHPPLLPAGVIEVTEEQEEEQEAEQEELEEELEEEGPGRSLITCCSLLLRCRGVLMCRGSLRDRVGAVLLSGLGLKVLSGLVPGSNLSSPPSSVVQTRRCGASPTL